MLLPDCQLSFPVALPHRTLNDCGYVPLRESGKRSPHHCGCSRHRNRRFIAHEAGSRFEEAGVYVSKLPGHTNLSTTSPRR
jgi:hypothetical protein